MQKPPKSFWQIWNMSFGFLGIQFGWGLQMANMSAIYEYLGARADQIPILWLAAPLTGLLVQPIIGHASDHTWTRLGRRRPYFLAGAILSSLALILMPRCSALWMAAGLLWILDSSINISMEPFRAFVADLLPEEQRTQGFAMQSLFIGLGAVFAAMPWFLTHVFHLLPDTTAHHVIPNSIRYSFYIGGASFFAAVLWTILTTKEYPPENIDAFLCKKAERRGLASHAAEIFHAIREMPLTMRQLAPVQLFTWFGLFCMWLYFPVAVARNVYGASDPTVPSYTAGIEWGTHLFRLLFGGMFCFFVSSALVGASPRPQNDPQSLSSMRRAWAGICRLDPPPVLPVAVHDGGWYRLGEHALHAICRARQFFSSRTYRRLHGDFQLLHCATGDLRLAVFRLGDAAPAPQ